MIDLTLEAARTIVETFARNDVEITEIVAAGGLIKNKFLMQMYADVCKLPISVGQTTQPGALGSAVFAAVAAGAYPDVKAATMAMGSKEENAYLPRPEASEQYDRLFAEYTKLHDYFGRGCNEVMHTLKDIRRDATRRHAERNEGKYSQPDTSQEQISQGGKDYYPVV